MNLGTPTKVKCNGKSMEMYADKQSRTISCCTVYFLALYKVALFHSHLCVGFNMRHKRFYVNERTVVYCIFY